MAEFSGRTVDLEAQPENSGMLCVFSLSLRLLRFCNVGTGSVYEMNHRTSGDNGEAPSSSRDISPEEVLGLGREN
jgi:hypothetical protein